MPLISFINFICSKLRELYGHRDVYGLKNIENIWYCRTKNTKLTTTQTFVENDKTYFILFTSVNLTSVFDIHI